MGGGVFFFFANYQFACKSNCECYTVYIELSSSNSRSVTVETVTVFGMLQIASTNLGESELSSAVIA